MLAQLTSVFKLPDMLTTVDIGPIGSVGSNGPEWRGMRPRNRRHVSVLMIGVRPISSSSSAQVWAPQDAKGSSRVVVVAGDTRELVRAGMAGSAITT